MFQSRYMPCTECGTSLDHVERDEHECDPGRRLEYQLFQHRAAIGRFDDEFAAYLGSAQGRFAVWYAEQTRLRRTGDN
jgi:hypothetical protein